MKHLGGNAWDIDGVTFFAPAWATDDAKVMQAFNNTGDPAEDLQKPLEVTRFQAKAALAQAGLLASVEAMVAEGDDMTKLAWQEANVFLRNSPTIAALAAALNLSGAEVDALFEQAAAIEA